MRRLSIAITLCAVVAAWGCASNAPPSGRGMSPEYVEGGVIFRFYDPEAKHVYVVGDFNNWSVKADPMVDANGDGEWTLFYTLGPGVYQYKFVVDGTSWLPDPRNPESAPDGFDGRNSVVRIAPPGS